MPEPDQADQLDVPISGRDRAEANVAKELSKFQVLYDVAVAMTAERSLDENLSLVVSKSRELLRGDTAYIALQDNEAGYVYMHILSGIRTEAFKRMRLPIGAGLGGKVASTGKGFIIEDYFEEVEPVVHEIVRAEGLISGMAAPLQISQVNLGVLYVFNRNRTKFDKSDLDTLCLLGNLAALEITRKRAEDKLRETHDELEKRVKERTGELSKVNLELLLEIEERKRAEEALRKEKQRFQSLSEHAPFGLVMIDDKGDFTYVNPKFKELFGYDSRDIPNGKTWFRQAYPDQEYRREVIAAWIRDEARTCSTDQVARTYVVTCKDGTEKIVRFWPMHIDDGQRLLTCEDITQSKLAEAALTESEEKYRKLVDHSPDGIHVVVEGRVVFANNATAQILGLERPEDLLGTEVLNFIHPEFREVVKERMVSTLQLRIPVPPLEEKYLRPDGTEIDVEVTAIPLTYKGRDAAQVIVRNITDRKRAEQALRESEEKYRRVVDNANDAIVVAQDGVLKFMNPKAKEMLGYVDDAPAMPFLSFVYPEDREMVLQRYLKRLRGEPAPPRYSFRILDKDNNMRWVDLSSVVINWEGRFATLNFISDITERRKIEEDLLKVEKLQSVGLLAGGIAHDFNNILAAILGNISLAKVYSSPGDKAYERLKQAEKACVRAQGLTQQLLTFSKGGVPLKEVTDLSRLVRECCLFALRGTNIRCEFDFADDQWPTEVDQGQISQVIDNLVINASHAMTEGGLIQVRGRNVVVSLDDGLPLEPGKYVRISLKDHGVGISKEHLPRIFDPYFTTKQTGSGLGLATSYAVITRHGGLITVESELGAGSTFHIYLAASDKEMKDQQDSDQQPEPGIGRILLMDDEELIRDLGEELLSLLGYEAVLARDGKEAVELYKKAYESRRPFDAIIVDLTVPGGMGGSEVVKILREFDPDLKAIVSSGYSNDPVMADYKSFGFYDVVAKPYTVNELSETLKKIIPRAND
jgi:PAS domain S-box-containing protein